MDDAGAERGPIARLRGVLGGRSARSSAPHHIVIEACPQDQVEQVLSIARHRQLPVAHRYIDAADGTQSEFTTTARYHQRVLGLIRLADNTP